MHWAHAISVYRRKTWHTQTHTVHIATLFLVGKHKTPADSFVKRLYCLACMLLLFYIVHTVDFNFFDMCILAIIAATVTRIGFMLPFLLRDKQYFISEGAFFFCHNPALIFMCKSVNVFVQKKKNLENVTGCILLVIPFYFKALSRLGLMEAVGRVGKKGGRLL